MEKCKGGKHTLIVIYSSYRDPLSDCVVRWCKYCGAVVIDIDYDGRTNPGAILPMQFPETAKIPG